MSRNTVPPARGRAHEEHKVRLTRLERKVDAGDLAEYRPEAVFSCWGEVWNGESPAWVPRTVLLLVEVIGILGDPSLVGGVSFRIRRAGSNLGSTITIPQDSTAVGPVRFDEAFSPDTDRLTVEVTDRGESARDLTVICRFK